MFGLSDVEMQIISNVGAANPEIEKIILFGSRALGNYKKGSDIDLAIVGNITMPKVWRLAGYLNDEARTLHHFDLVNLATVTNQNLVQHVADHGVTLYQRPQDAVS